MVALTQGIVAIGFIILAVWVDKKGWDVLAIFLAIGGLIGGCELMARGWQP